MHSAPCRCCRRLALVRPAVAVSEMLDVPTPMRHCRESIKFALRNRTCSAFYMRESYMFMEPHIVLVCHMPQTKNMYTQALCFLQQFVEQIRQTRPGVHRHVRPRHTPRAPQKGVPLGHMLIWGVVAQSLRRKASNNDHDLAQDPGRRGPPFWG